MKAWCKTHKVECEYKVGPNYGLYFCTLCKGFPRELLYEEPESRVPKYTERLRDR